MIIIGKWNDMENSVPFTEIILVTLIYGYVQFDVILHEINIKSHLIWRSENIKLIELWQTHDNWAETSHSSGECNLRWSWHNAMMIWHEYSLSVWASSSPRWMCSYDLQAWMLIEFIPAAYCTGVSRHRRGISKITKWTPTC